MTERCTSCGKILSETDRYRRYTQCEDCCNPSRHDDSTSEMPSAVLGVGAVVEAAVEIASGFGGSDSDSGGDFDGGGGDFGGGGASGDF